MPEIFHKLTLGISRWGKSYNNKCEFLDSRGGGIYFNPRKSVISGTVGIDRDSPRAMVINALKKGYKLTYKMSGSLQVDRRDINRLINILFAEKWPKGLLLVFDEAQDYSPQGDTKSGLLRVARTGLGENIRAIFNCQRPADLSKIIVSQCEVKIFYGMPPEDLPWLKSRNYPHEAIAKLIAGRKYYYVEYFAGKLSPVRKIKYRGEI